MATAPAAKASKETSLADSARVVAQGVGADWVSSAGGWSGSGGVGKQINPEVISQVRLELKAISLAGNGVPGEGDTVGGKAWDAQIGPRPDRHGEAFRVAKVRQSIVGN